VSTDKLPIQATSFIGRTKELMQIGALVADPVCRLLTLVGPGGIGKTRLALEAARQLPADSARFVELQSLTSPDLLVTAIAEALGFQFYSGDNPKQQLLDYLCEQTWLLLLDNFEHLLDGAPLLSEILAAAPAIHLLVTSRERLNLIEEWVLDISGLAYPIDDSESALQDFSAVELFVQHARRASVGFTLTDTSRPAVIRVCRLVDGMPLGIELAASRLRVLSCEAIADEIERSLDILETPARNVESRHRTMRAAFEPTWNRLSADERDVFMRLSVFRGGFTREAAQIVADASLRALSALVDKSLLRVSEGGRYELHELLRQYAEEQLHPSGKVEAVHDAHSLYYADFLHQRLEDMKGRRQLAALAEIAVDFENVRAAWMWAVDHKSINIIYKMVEGLWLFCDLYGRPVERLALFRYAEQQFANDLRPEQERLWGQLAARAFDERDTDETPLESAFQIARRCGDLAEIGRCLEIFAATAYNRQDYVGAKQLAEESLALYRQLGDPYYQAWILMQLQSWSYQEGLVDFQRFGFEAYRLRHQIGDRIGVAWSLSVVAHTESRNGHFEEAERLWLERIALGREIDHRHLIAIGYAHVSYAVYFIQGDFAKSRFAAEEVFRLLSDLSHSNAPKWAFATLCLLACMDEDYQESKTFYQKATSARGLAWANDLALFGHCLANCGLEDYPAARADLAAVLPRIVNFPGLSGVVLCLPVAAILLTRDGDPVLAVELLGLAFSHPSRASGWMEKWPLLIRLRLQLEQALGTEAYRSAWERGTHLDIDAVEVKLRAMFLSEPSPPKANASPSSVKPLSDRELEILHLIAEGHSNQDIADRLYVGVSTVKKHINHIYDKLDAKNRTQAVALARERNILPR